MGAITIDPDVPVGTVILNKLFPPRGEKIKFLECDNKTPGFAYYEVLKGAPVAGYDSVYSTWVAGVGIRLTSYTFGWARHYPTKSDVRSDDLYAQPEGYFGVELIKTGPITGSGTWTTGPYAQGHGDDNLPFQTITIVGSGVTIVHPACTVNAGSKNILVQFGKVARSSFNGVGSTAATRSFDIKLNCSAGVAESKTINIRMDATKDPSGQPGVLQLTQGANVATGVGIHVLDKNYNGVKFGDDQLVGPSKDGSYVLSYMARYIETAPNVTVGQASGVATFTVTYK